MKKIIALVFIMVAVTTIHAQGFHMGVKAGANLNKMDGESFNSNFRLGYELGGFAEIDFSKSIGIQPELLFDQTNTTVTNSGSQIFNVNSGDNIQLNYLSIPVLLKINTGLLTIHLGPQYSILINNHKTTLQNSQDAFKSGNFAVIAGLQLNLQLLKIYARYTVGLSDINDIGSQNKLTSQQIQFGLGLRVF